MKSFRLTLFVPILALGCATESLGPAGGAGAPSGGMAGAAGNTNSGAGGLGGSAGAAGAGTGGTASGGAGAGGVAGSANAGAGGVGGTAGATPGENYVPSDYTGTPFKAIQLPGTVYLADYDRGGPGVAYCHGNEANCGDGVVTGDWAPANTPPYREPLAEGAPMGGGAACDDNVGLCRMNPAKPDNTVAGVAVSPQDTYLCYVATNQWTKYTVEVTEAGSYSVAAFTAAPGGVMVNLDFGSSISTGDFAIPESSTATCACTESYHAWATHENLATVTFGAPGTYLMTFKVVSNNLNPDTFTFTKL